MVLAIASNDSVLVWNGTKNDSPLSQYSSGGEIQSMAWNHNGQVLATVSRCKDISVDPVLLWSFNSEKLLETLGKEIIRHSPFIEFGGKSRYLCIASERNVFIWDLKKQSVARKIPCRSKVLECHIQSVDSMVYALCEEEVQVFGLRDAKCVASIRLVSRAKQYRFDTTSQSISVATEDSIIYFFDVVSMGTGLSLVISETREPCLVPTRPIQLEATTNGVDLIVLSSSKCFLYREGSVAPVIDFSPKTATCISVQDNMLAVGFTSGMVQLYDTTTWRATSASCRIQFGVKRLLWSPQPSYSALSVKRKSLPTSSVPSSAALLLHEEMSSLRVEMRNSLQAMHVDMVQQFHLQATEFSRLMQRQVNAIDQLSAENRALRTQVAKLQQEPNGPKF